VPILSSSDPHEIGCWFRERKSVEGIGIRGKFDVSPQQSNSGSRSRGLWWRKR
jgi:hypothetical protein